MKAGARHIAAISRLLVVGEVRVEALAGVEKGTTLGLWVKSADGRQCVATRALVQLDAILPCHEEAIAAVLASERSLRPAWSGILAARLKEMGQRRDVAGLCAAIGLLGPATASIRALLATAGLLPTGHGELETALFGAPAEQAVALPRLLRALGATADLIEGGLGQPAQPLPEVEPLAPGQSWCPGRLLRLPDLDQTPPVGATSVLTGSLKPLASKEQVEEDVGRARMRWVLCRPWAMLLAQIVFVQEAWAAEQISGRLALELGEDQIGHFQQPGRVDVVVTTADGDEIVCGTLGQLVERVLGRLGVTILARPEELTRLDERLGVVIGVLLENKVWRHEAGGGLGGRSGYVIDEAFSTSCYRTFGSKHFYRLGSLLTGAIRLTCERWAQERLSQAGRVAMGRPA